MPPAFFGEGPPEQLNVVAEIGKKLYKAETLCYTFICSYPILGLWNKPQGYFTCLILGYGQI